MNHRLLSLVLLGALLGLAAPGRAQQAPPAKTYIDKMLNAIDQVKFCKFMIKSKERFGKQYLDKQNFMKINKAPFQVYLKDQSNGVEVLYIDGWNNNKCYINPNGFPWTNVSFSPLADRVRQEQHHTIFEAGFWYLGNTMRGLIKRIENEKRDYNRYFKYLGESSWGGTSYYKLSLTNDEFAYENYTLTKDETPREIAQRLHLNDALIEVKNNIGHGRIKAGTTIKVPNSFAKKVELFLDKNTYLPYIQVVYDENGLFEQYEMYNVEINPTFAPDEFLTTNKAFGFK
jgi:outer membrane lipoprotein-sorting protein